MYIKILFDNARLKGVLKLILILSIVHLACFYSNLRAPFGLLYGPLLLLIVRKMEARRFWMHILPFFLFSCLYLAFTIDAAVLGGWQRYYAAYLIVLAVSLFSYALTISMINSVKNNTASDADKEFIQLLLYGCYFAAILVTLLAIRIGLGILDFGFDPVSMLFFQLGIFIVLICMFLVFSGKKEKGRIKQKNRTGITGLDDSVSTLYIETLEKCVRETDIYRNPDISLEMLSVETTIPKHHLSQLLNGYLGKNFYQYIAELRIEYALTRLQNDSGIKIESLAYDCGFNSKTSFNRYFKEYTGCLPSYYKTKVQHL
ncbi:helix-turn-helix domain-containing protein [Flavobacterium cerinum]|uniref:Helix-turn-helix domain-containing protein n=1 Tax=Flavobacterium cerinum TaxID=2502784 RepID=A0ABY5IQ10_9FLAO|nr:helix-turn-helix domain-containing protein [Flavobacterium cerinum]UUC43863.1 helix-turn-helix domain-containing protein [Flavobacterium cerinum]